MCGTTYAVGRSISSGRNEGRSPKGLPAGGPDWGVVAEEAKLVQEDAPGVAVIVQVDGEGVQDQLAHGGGGQQAKLPADGPAGHEEGLAREDTARGCHIPMFDRRPSVVAHANEKKQHADLKASSDEL